MVKTRTVSAIEDLRIILNEEDPFKKKKQNVLFITGAGISASCGVPLYRVNPVFDKIGRKRSTFSAVEKRRISKKNRHNNNKNNKNNNNSNVENPIWNNFVETWATTKAFVSDPVKWYAEFWNLTHFSRDLYFAGLNNNNNGTNESEGNMKMKPSKAHQILSNFLQTNPNNCRLITQNVDGLHFADLSPHNIIEAHGRIGRYRCASTLFDQFSSFPDKNKEECPYARHTFFEAHEVALRSSHDGSLIRKDGRHSEEEWFELLQKNAPPVCVVCGSYCVPLALMFDEKYSCHKALEWRKAHEWLSKYADVLIFVGTSFSVLLTDVALAYAYAQNKKTVYNINIASSLLQFQLGQKQLQSINRVLAGSELTEEICEECSGCEGDFWEIMVYPSVYNLCGGADEIFEKLLKKC